MLWLTGAAVAADGWPVRIVDGATVEVEGEPVSLLGIGAPELHALCSHNDLPLEAGEWSAIVLRMFIWRDTIECAPIRRDDEGRAVARCTVRGMDLGALMAMSGWAWRLPDSAVYAAEEAEARDQGRGLWGADDCQPPWQVSD